MAWMPKSDAAIALRLSPLVLSRQIAVGRFRTKTVAGKVLVEVEESADAKNATDPPQPKSSSDMPTLPPQDDVQVPTPADETGVFQRDRAPEADARGADRGEEGDKVLEDSSTYDTEVCSAAIDAVQKVRAYCDRESRMAHAEAERAWSACERTEHRLRVVTFVAAAMLLIALAGVFWLDRIHQRERQVWSAKVTELETAITENVGRQSGEAEGIRAAFATFREQADADRAELQSQLMHANAELAASRVEGDHACWERDEALRERDRLANEVASQRAHIEKMQSLQTNVAAKSLKNLLDESWDMTRTPESVPVTQPASNFQDGTNPQLSSRR